jgi:H+/Cl- antiporter ClcA
LVNGYVTKLSDKILHLLAGFVIATVFQFSWIAVIIAVLFFGIGKEVYDVVKGGNFDWRDLGCTIFGGMCGGWVAWVYNI